MMNLPQSQLMVIFGASGDLSKRKLFPALFALFIRNLLPKNFRVLGVARTQMSSEQFRDLRKKDLPLFLKSEVFSQAQLDEFIKLIDYVYFNTDVDDEYVVLKEKVQALQKDATLDDNILFYLGTPPEMYEIIASALKKVGLNKSNDGFRRIVVEKPFGHDYDSAIELNKVLSSIFQEKEIYRIDHYLGKETVQNILVLRFANGIFEPLWNRNYIDSVEITVSETLGVEARGAYYEKSGALRDMVQNHLLHLMAYVAMECPPSFDSESVRDEIVKVFRALQIQDEQQIAKNVFRGQYAAGVVDGKQVGGYLGEKNVSADSQTETFVAMRFFIDNWRWGGVPFYFYTGKRLSEKKSEIVINFKSTPQNLFMGQCSGRSCNRLTIRIQPNEGISLKFGLKVPGEGFNVAQVAMDFNYSSIAGVKLPDAYERLLLDAMVGEATLFARSDAAEAGWKFVDPIIKFWNKIGYANLARYDAGSIGTKDAMDMMREHSPISCQFFSDKNSNEDS